MARLWQGGAELNSVTDGVEVSTNTGNIAISSTTVHGGAFSWRFNPTAAISSGRQIIKTSNSSSSAFVRAYVNVASYPAATRSILSFLNASNVACASIAMDNAGHLLLRDASSTQIGSSSSVLSLGQWYRVELNLDASSSPGSATGRLNGTNFATGANSAQSPWARIAWGIISATSADLYIDDVALNDTSGANQTSWPGSGSIIHLRPNAAGDANSFAVQVGGTAGSANNFTRVSERPPDDATSYNGSAVLNQEDLFRCTASGIASNSVITTVLVGLRIADLVSADASAGFKAEIIKTSGGTKAQSVNIVPNSTTWGTNTGADPRTYPIILYADPDGASWTQATLDTMQVGYLLDVVNTQTIAVSTVWASVDYTAAVASTLQGSTLSLMGVG